MDNDTQKLIQLLKNVEKSGDQMQSPPIENNFDSKSQFQPQMTANLINSFLQSPNPSKPSSRTNSPYSSYSPNLNNFFNQNAENNSNELSSYIPPETKEIEIKLDGNYTQTKSMNITKCETQVNLPIGQIIDSNRNFICYVVKNSLIRVIHKNTGATGLCRGPHTQPITDIKFVYDDILSSVGKDGNIFFWKLSHSNNKTHVDLLLNICPPDSNDSVSYTRLCYNTSENPLFAVISKNNTVYIWNLEEQISQRNSSVPVVDFNETSPLSLKSNDEFLDFCFWNNQLVTADSAGKLKFWNISSQSVESEVLLHNSPITTVIFILDSYVLTASHSNKELKLWNVNSFFNSSGSRTPLQTILFADNQFDGSQLLSYNFEASILAAASVNMPVLSLLHFCAKRKRFNYITKFNSLENSLSISSLRNDLDIEIYAVQPKSIRVYTSKIELLVPIDNSFVLEDDNVELEQNAIDDENACENNENISENENEKEEIENENENGDDENANDYNDNENDNEGDGNEADYDNNDNQKENSDVNLKYLEGSDNSDSNIVHDLRSIEDNTTSDNNDNSAHKNNEDSSNNLEIKTDNNAKPSPKKSTKRRERRNKKEPIETTPLSSNSGLLFEQFRGNIDSRFKDFESNIVNQFNQSLLQLKHNMEKERAERERIEREQQARLLEAISKTVNQNLQRYVKEELNKLVPSVLSPILSANEKLEASSKVLNFDSLSKEIKNVVANTLSNRINENIGNSIRTPVQHELKNHFGTVLAPAIENSYQKMFSQLNEAFNQGLDHHFYQLSLKEASSTAEHLTNIVSQLNKVCDSMTDSITHRRNPNALFPPPDPFNSRPPPPQSHFPPEPFPSSRPQTYHPVTAEYLFERPPSPRYNPPPPSPYKPPLSYPKNPRHPGDSLPFPPPPYALSHSSSTLPPPFSGYPMDDPYGRMPLHLPPHPNPKIADLFSSDSNLNNNSLEAALAHKLKTSLNGSSSSSSAPASASLNSFLAQSGGSNSNSNITAKLNVASANNNNNNNNNNTNAVSKPVTKSASNPKTTKQQKAQPALKSKGKSGKEEEITSSSSNPNLISKALKTQSEGSEDSHPTKDQLVIDRLVSNKEFERAFSRALSLEDLKIVIYLCTKVEPTTVFTPPIKISQLILLSLIQQLGYDLSTDTKLKLAWIRDSLLFINSSDPSIANHVGPILNQLYKNLEKFFPMFLKDPDCATTFKLLLHVVNSLLNDIQNA